MHKISKISYILQLCHEQLEVPWSKIYQRFRTGRHPGHDTWRTGLLGLMFVMKDGNLNSFSDPQDSNADPDPAWSLNADWDSDFPRKCITLHTVNKRRLKGECYCYRICMIQHYCGYGSRRQIKCASMRIRIRQKAKNNKESKGKFKGKGGGGKEI